MLGRVVIGVVAGKKGSGAQVVESVPDDRSGGFLRQSTSPPTRPDMHAEFVDAPRWIMWPQTATADVFAIR